jgi:hypothetical protein
MAMFKAQIESAIFVIAAIGIVTAALFSSGVVFEKPRGEFLGIPVGGYYVVLTVPSGARLMLASSNPTCGTDIRYVYSNFGVQIETKSECKKEDPYNIYKCTYGFVLNDGANNERPYCGKAGCKSDTVKINCTVGQPLGGAFKCASAGQPGLSEPYSLIQEYNPQHGTAACRKCEDNLDPDATIGDPIREGQICWPGNLPFFNTDSRISSNPLAILGGSYGHRWCSSGECVWCGPDGTKQQSGGTPGTISGPQCGSNAQYGICADESKAGRAIIKCNSGSGNTGGPTATGWDCMTIGSAPNYQLTPSAGDWEYKLSGQTLSCIKCIKNVDAIPATPVKVDSSGVAVPQGDSTGQYEISSFYEDSTWGNKLLKDAYVEIPINKNWRCKDSSAGEFFCTDDSVRHSSPSRCVQNCEDCRIMSGPGANGKFYEGNCIEDTDRDNFVKALNDINGYDENTASKACLADCKNIDDTATCGADLLCSKDLKNPKKGFIDKPDLYYCKCSGLLPDGPDEGSDLDGYDGMYDDEDKCKLINLGEKITCIKDTNNNDLIQPYHREKIYIKNADYSGIVIEGALENLERDTSKKPKNCVVILQAHIFDKDNKFVGEVESDNCCKPQPLAQTPTSGCQSNNQCRLEIPADKLGPLYKVSISTRTIYDVWNSIDYKQYSTVKLHGIINIKPCPNGDVGTGPDFGLGTSGATGFCVCDDTDFDDDDEPDGYLYPADAQNPDGKCVKFRMTGAEWFGTRNDGSEHLDSSTTVFTPTIPGRERGEGFYRAKQDTPTYEIKYSKENINLGQEFTIRAQISATDYNNVDDPALSATASYSQSNVNDCSIPMPNSNSVEYLRKVKYEFRGDHTSGLFIKLWNGENYVIQVRSFSSSPDVFVLPLANKLKVKVMATPVDSKNIRGKPFPFEDAIVSLESVIQGVSGTASSYDCITNDKGECVFEVSDCNVVGNVCVSPQTYKVQPLAKILENTDNDPVVHRIAVSSEFLKGKNKKVYQAHISDYETTSNEIYAEIYRYSINQNPTETINVDVIDCKELEDKIDSKYSYPTTEFNKIYNPINRFRSVIGSRAMLSLCKVSLKVDNYALGPLARTGAFWGAVNTLLGMLSTVWSSITNFFSILWDKVTMVVKQVTMGNSINQDAYAKATEWVNNKLRPDMHWVTKIDAKQRRGGT